MKQIFLIIILSIIAMQAVNAVQVDIVSTNPAPIQAGDFADVTLRIESSTADSDYTNAQVNIVPTQYFRPISVGDAEFTRFESGRVVTKTFQIFVEEGLPEGFVDMQIEFESDQVTFEFDERIFVESKNTAPELLIGEITTTPKELLPDSDNNKIVITVQNLGDKDAELVKATLVSGKQVSPSYSFSMQDSVATIKAGEQEDLEFTIDLDETAIEPIPSKLELRYRTELSTTFETRSSYIPFDLEIVESPLLVIEKIDQVSSFTGGTTENEVLLTIKNEGNEDAEEVRIRLVPDISYPFIFETTTEYVTSNIKPGESATVRFKAEVTSDAIDKTYDITAKLESLVGEARYVREDTLSIQTREGAQARSGVIGTIVIVIILLTAGIIGFRRLKSRKKK